MTYGARLQNGPLEDLGLEISGRLSLLDSSQGVASPEVQYIGVRTLDRKHAKCTLFRRIDKHSRGVMRQTS